MQFVPSSPASPPATARTLAMVHGPHVGPFDVLRRLVIPFLALTALCLVADLAEAKRIGGGRSFGSRDGYSRPYEAPAAPNRTVTPPAQTAPPGQSAASPLSRPGGFGGLGGMFGGLLMGGLIGSLLFGGQGGGIGLLEIALLGGGLYLVMRFLRSRGGTRRDAPPQGGERFAYATPQADPATPSPESRRFDGWASLDETPAGSSGTPRDAAPGAPVVPPGMDEAEFLAGAKALFARLQAAWDRRDLDDIRRFVTPGVMAEIDRQATDDPAPGKTDVLMVEARILEAGTTDGRTVITVLFDALLREDHLADAPNQVREVWRISRDERAAVPEWTLEGIQQLAM